MQFFTKQDNFMIYQAEYNTLFKNLLKESLNNPDDIINYYIGLISDTSIDKYTANTLRMTLIG